VRYGVMHRNTFLSSPGKLNSAFEVIKKPGLYFAGQITGVEGYVESAASGFIAGFDLARRLIGRERIVFLGCTAMGALARYVSSYAGKDFQPMNVNFGIMDSLDNAPRDKRMRYEMLAQRALATIDYVKNENKM